MTNFVGIESINLKVLIFDTDYYALQAMNGYLAWDRRTRVTHLAESVEQVWRHLEETPFAELPDVIVFDVVQGGSAAQIAMTLRRLQQHLPDCLIFCTLPRHDSVAQVLDLLEAVAQVGARGVFVKQEVRLQIAWAIVYARGYSFVLTASLAKVARHSPLSLLQSAHVLPPQRQYPEMTDRVRQAIALTVIEGMPAHLAAHEMGISLHTVRGYVKEGYRIMEAHDHSEYPVDMTPQERAFMRFTAFQEPANGNKEYP